MDYIKRIDDYKDQMITTLKDLVEFKSIAEDEPPFGEEVQKAFKYMLSLGKADGFTPKNVSDMAGHLEFFGNNDGPVLGILAHLDVVKEGEGWDYPPFSCTIEDNKIYGRGTSDDKGPLVAAYYAMKALKDEGFVPNGKVRLILGLDEEPGNGWQGMKAYFEEEPYPDFGFTPDAEFPVIHAEKGILIFHIVKKLDMKNSELRSLKGGTASNMVASSARAVVRFKNNEKIKKLEAEDIEIRTIGKNLRIKAAGIPAHGAKPYLGKNAISTLFAFLGKLEFSDDNLSEFISFYNNHLGFDLHGERLDCEFEDEISGKLTVNVGEVEIDEKIARLTLNVRYPVTYSAEDVYSKIIPILDKYNMGLIKHDHQEALFIPTDNYLVKKLIEVYQKRTNDFESKPIAIGGGTYARAMKNAVAFGMTFPGKPETAHQKNEYIEIDDFILAAKIYADAIYELTKDKGDQEENETN